MVERDCAELGFGFSRDAHFDSICSSRSFVWVYFDHVDQQMALVYLDGPRKVLLLWSVIPSRVKASKSVAQLLRKLRILSPTVIPGPLNKLKNQSAILMGINRLCSATQNGAIETSDLVALFEVKILPPFKGFFLFS